MAIIESEKVLERKLSEWVKALGGISIKLSAMYFTGLPDRMVLLPEGIIFFCELKTTGKQPTKIQERVHATIRKLGFKVYVVDSSDTISSMLKTELNTKLKND